MAITQRQAVNFSAGSNPTAAESFASSPLTGNLVVAYFYCQNNALATISDNQGNSANYQYVFGRDQGNNGLYLGIAWVENAQSNGGTFTITIATNAGSVFNQLSLAEYSSGVAGGVLRKDQTFGNLIGNGTSFASSPATPTVTPELLIANVIAGGTVSVGSGFTQSSNSVNGQLAEYLVTSSGGSTTVTGNTTPANNWSIFGLSFAIQANAPTFSPNGGTFSAPQTVTISSTTAGGTIYYTTDGSTPTTGSSSIANGGTVLISTSVTLKAMETAAGFSNSTVASAVFTITSGGPVGWSPVDSRTAVPKFGPAANTGIVDAQGNTIYSAQKPPFTGNSQVSDNAAIPPVDSRAAGAPVDSRASKPVNSRTAPPFHG